MPLDGEYEPSTQARVRAQVERYEASGGAKGATMGGRPVIILTTRGARTGKLRKAVLMRVEHDGAYAVVASLGGAARNPLWVHNIRADRHVELQDGAMRQDMLAKELSGEERGTWWERAVAAFPTYAGYQRRTAREIPVFLLEPPPG